MALSAVNVIGDVTDAIGDILSELTPSFGSPAVQTVGEQDPPRVNIFLYQVLESPIARNRTWRTRPSGDQEYPPVALKLYYLFTPYAADMITEHHVLGDTVRTLNDHAIMRGTELPESLRLHIDQIAIVLMPLHLEDLTRIWSALQTAFRLSVAYEVRVVPIHSDIVVTPSRVRTKIDQFSQL